MGRVLSVAARKEMLRLADSLGPGVTDRSPDAIRAQLERSAAHAGAGGRRKQRGTQWEKIVEQINAFYRTHRWVPGRGYHPIAVLNTAGAVYPPEAVLSRCPPPVVGPNGAARYTGSGDCDFAGRWRTTPVMFDAKTCTREYVEIDAKQRHQPKLLLDFGAEPGSLAFFLVNDPEQNICVILDDRADLTRLADGLKVRIRKGDTWLKPTIAEATPLELARGGPRYDYLAYFRAV